MLVYILMQVSSLVWISPKSNLREWLFNINFFIVKFGENSDQCTSAQAHARLYINSSSIHHHVYTQKGLQAENYSTFTPHNHNYQFILWHCAFLLTFKYKRRSTFYMSISDTISFLECDHMHCIVHARHLLWAQNVIYLKQSIRRESEIHDKTIEKY